MRAIRGALVALVCAAAPEIRAEEPPAAEEEVLLEEEVVEIVEEAPVVDASAPAETVTREEVQALPGARGDAVEGVRNLPGVAFASAYAGGAGDLIVRGTSGTDSWYLLDGVPIPSAMHFGNLTSVIPVEMIESIELSPGGFDVAYGRATGGLVEIRSRPAWGDAWRAVTDVSFIHASAFVQGPLVRDRLVMAASVRRSFLDAFLPAVIPDEADLSFTTAPVYADAELKLDWVPGARHTVSLFGLYSDDEMALRLDQENPTDPVFTGAFREHDRFWRAIGSWRYEGERVQTRVVLGYGGDLESAKLNQTHHLDLDVKETSARGDVAVRMAAFAKLRAGVDLRGFVADVAARLPVNTGEGTPEMTVTASPTWEIDDRFTDLQSAAYLATDLRFGPATVTPGLRVDHYAHIDDLVLQPRLASEVDLGRGFLGRAAVGRFSRPMAMEEQIPEDLEAETAIQASAGLEKRFGPALRLQGTLFSTWLDDLVVYDVERGAQDALDGYVSRGTGTARGLELLARVRRGDLFGWLAYTYSRSRRVDAPGADERLFDQDQPHNLVAAASWALGAWRFGARFRLASGTPFTPVVGSVYDADAGFYRPIHGPSNSARLEASHQLDLRVDREFRGRGWRLSAYLDVSNVYANPRVVDYAYDFDYRNREPITDMPLVPSIGLRGEI